MAERDTFEYTYSAKQQEEIEAIRKKYVSLEEDKMEQLRRLDKSVGRPGTIAAIAFGIVGCLLLGIGMSCTMVWADDLFVLGIFIGIIGMVVISLAYPVYTKITKRQKEIIAPQILALTEELKK